MERALVVTAAIAALSSAAGCSAPATLPELQTAERRAGAGDVDGALAAYREAQVTCHELQPQRRAKAACADALLGEAEVLDHAGRTRAAIDTYLAIPARAPDDPTTSAIATHRAGELLLRAGDITPAWTALWRVVTDWPDEAPAADALRALLQDGRRRDPRGLADQLTRVLPALAGTDVADNIVWSLADLAEREPDPEGTPYSLFVVVHEDRQRARHGAPQRPRHDRT